MKRPINPHLAILWAFRNQRGLRLSPADVRQLALDEAIKTAALTCEEAAKYYPEEEEFSGPACP